MRHHSDAMKEEEVEKIKQMIGPALVGAVIGMILLVFAGGFVSGGTATELAAQAAEDATVAALSPLCVLNANADPDKKAEIMALPSHKKRGEIAKTNWVIYPDGASSSLKRAIDQGCSDGLK